MIVLPVVVVIALFAASVQLGAVAAVMVVGVWAASGGVCQEPHRPPQRRGRPRRDPDRGRSSPARRCRSARSAAPLVDRLRQLGFPPNDIGQVTGFDGGCIVKRRNRRDVSVVVGDDGGVAYFDPRWVDDLRAASEYRAGRGREPTSYVIGRRPR